MKIYNLGSLNIDYVYSVDHIVKSKETISSDSLQIFAGGKGLNQSIALSRAGSNVIHGGIIGKDGEFLKDVLQNENVDVSMVKILNNPTGHAIIQVDKVGQNSILLYAGTNFAINREYVEEFLRDAEQGDFLLLQNEISSLNDVFEIAFDKKMQIVFNPSPFSKDIEKLPLEYVKWWFCNEIEAGELFGSDDVDTIAQNFLSKYPNSSLILTLGESGSVFINKDQVLKQEAYKTNVIDTTAAGDTYTGYFVDAITKKQTVKNAMQIASKAASITVSREGAANSIPRFNEIK